MEKVKSGNKRNILIGILAIVVVSASAWVYFNFRPIAQMVNHMSLGGNMHAGPMHGANGSGHDEVNMPGLKGENASAEESAELAVMFRNFDKITREVTNLPNGIRTITNSTDEEVMAKLVSHVVGMIGRVEELSDPKIFIQSPTLDIFFKRGKNIKSEIDVTDKGIVVTQTSNDPELVKALQTHAAEVTDMADRGMQAVHESMMKRNNM